MNLNQFFGLNNPQSLFSNYLAKNRMVFHKSGKIRKYKKNESFISCSFDRKTMLQLCCLFPADVVVAAEEDDGGRGVSSSSSFFCLSDHCCSEYSWRFDQWWLVDEFVFGFDHYCQMADRVSQFPPIGLVFYCFLTFFEDLREKKRYFKLYGGVL